MSSGSQRAKGTPARDAAVLKLLERGEMEIKGLVPWSSNYTYVARIFDETREMLAVYKPSCGERPLWDFETGTLCNRELAAYLVSVELGWPNIPPTVLRDGPRGVGAVQQFIQFKRRENFFTLRHHCVAEMQEIAVFDALVNNTDRKGGHVLVDQAGAVWCIDHGVTFHEDYKLRTVIWDFVGDPIPERLLADLKEYHAKTRPGKPARQRLEKLLSVRELRAMDRRLGTLLQERVFPDPPEDWPHIPWPPV